MSPRRRGRGHPPGGQRPPQPETNGDRAPRLDAEPARLEPVEAATGEVATADAAETEAAEPASTGPRRTACTLAQLRRFIKSRPYVPIHELRRRFLIEGFEDEVSGFAAPAGQLYVGLPPPEAALLGELVRGGEVGYELLLDPTCPAIIGVFPMRPVARL